MRITEIKQGLQNNNYMATNDIVFAAAGAINEQIPLLIEGAPGAGKTALAKATADMLGAKLIRVQFYHQKQKTPTDSKNQWEMNAFILPFSSYLIP